METDAKELNEQNQMKLLETTKQALKQKLERNQKESKEVLDLLEKERELYEKEEALKQEAEKKIEEYKKIEQQVDAR